MSDISPVEWGARIDYDLWTPSGTPRDKIVAHYGGSNNPAGDVEDPAVEMDMLRRWERFHIDSRGWRGIAYGWAIGQSGTRYRLRGHADYAAHRGDLDEDGIPENKEAFPIVFILGGTQAPSDRALSSFTTLRSRLGNLPVYGHREIAGLGHGTRTACPGVHLISYVRQLREADVAEFPPKTRNDMRRDLGDPQGVPDWASWDEYIVPVAEGGPGGSTIPESGPWPVQRYDLAWYYKHFVEPLENENDEQRVDLDALTERVKVLEAFIVDRPSEGIKAGQAVTIQPLSE